MKWSSNHEEMERAKIKANALRNPAFFECLNQKHSWICAIFSENYEFSDNSTRSGYQKRYPERVHYLQYSTAVRAATLALLYTRRMLDARESPPVSSATRASRKGVVALP